MSMRIITNLKAPKINAELSGLWKLAFAEAKHRGIQKRVAYAVWDYIGLYLNPSPCRSASFEPINSLCFASSAGLSFGFLTDKSLRPDEYPIVMSVEWSFDDRPHSVLGENLHEFLSLGCYGGYDELESLSFRDDLRKSCIERLEKRRHDLVDEKVEMLSRLRDGLELKPWKNVGTRLEQLEKKWKHIIKIGGRE